MEPAHIEQSEEKREAIVSVLTVEVYKQLERRVSFPLFGLRDFDPFTASPTELRDRKLPPKPDPTQTPRAYAAWRQLLSPPLNSVDISPAREYFTVQFEARQRVRLAQAPIAEAGRNWSGAYVRAPVDSAMSIVYGTWRVPTCLPAPEAQVGGNYLDGHWNSSAWIGFDGHDPASVTMPQLGTQHKVVVDGGPPVPAIVPWVQWWLRDDPHNSQIGLPITAVAGDTMRAMITVLDPTHVNFAIRNLTTNMIAHFDMSAPGATPEPIERLTAEWIVERQTNPLTLQLEPFNNYQICHFSSVGAVRRDAAHGNADVDLTEALPIEIVLWDDLADPGRVASMPDPIGAPDQFTCRYVIGVP